MTDYRLLNVGELRRPGDEFYPAGEGDWHPVHPDNFGSSVEKYDAPVRRRTTLRVDLEALAKEWSGRSALATRLADLIAKHYPTQEP